MITAYPIANRRYLNTLTKKRLLTYFNYYVKPIFLDTGGLAWCLYEPRANWLKEDIIQSIIDACQTLHSILLLSGVTHYYPVAISPCGLFYYHKTKGYCSSYGLLEHYNVTRFNSLTEAIEFTPKPCGYFVAQPTHVLLACDFQIH